jgi:hypothetical protein
MMARARGRARTYEPRLATTAAMTLLALGTTSRASTAADGATGLPRDTAAASPRPIRRLVVIQRERGKVAVVERVLVRLAAELRAAGFEVEERVSDVDEQGRSPGEAGDDGTSATVVLRRLGERIEADVSTMDRSTHKTSFRQIESRPGEGSDRSLALGVVELVRASLGDPLPPSHETETPSPSQNSSPGSTPAPAAPPATPPPPPPIVPPEAIEAPTQPREVLPETLAAGPPLVGLRLGVAGVYAGPDIGPSLAPELRVLWHASSVVDIGAFGAATVSGGAIGPREQGAAKIGSQIALIDASAELPVAGALRAFFSGGAGAYHLVATPTGETARGYVGRADDVWVAVVAIGAGTQWRITPLLSIVIDVRELLTLPRPVVRFGGESVAEAMHPGTLAGVSMAMDL